jgi:hypothetical protein
MYDNQIPILAYAFIGITTLVLTYATLTDNDVTNKTPTATESSSITSMLPNLNVFSNSPAKPEVVESKPEPVVANPISEEAKPATNIVGGKRSKHKRNKNKKTKRNRK